MSRLIPIILILLLILLIIALGIFAYVKIKKSVRQLYSNLLELKEQQQYQSEKQKLLKKSPDFVQKGVKYFDTSVEIASQLSIEWKKQLHPLINQSEWLIHRSIFYPKDNKHIRNFFVVSLPQIQRFLEMLQENQERLSPDEITQAQQSLRVIYQDLENYQKKINDKKRFDFDVAMKVIKQRLGKPSK